MNAGRSARRPARGPRVVGLTGPIGCGKSTVARWIVERGGVLVDADVLARDVTAPGAPTLPAIRGRFGDAVFAADGSLDRAALASVVFSDPAALRDLEAIVHPAVHVRILGALDAARASGAPFVAIEAIKLVEAGLAALCDEVWIVECEPQAQRARLAGRGVPAEDAERRIVAQGAGLADRLAERLATDAPDLPVRRLRTDGPESSVRNAVEAVLDEVR